MVGCWAGGLAADGQTWLPARKRFLLPVKALSKLFRAQCQQALKGGANEAPLPARLWPQPWVVHCQPVGVGQTALKYLAPYIFRVTLSNRRLVKLEAGRVTFRYTHAHSRQSKLCTLPVDAFLHRSLLHFLPMGFVKVRYYGLFAPAQRAHLAALRERLAQPATAAPIVIAPRRPAHRHRSYWPASQMAVPSVLAHFGCARRQLARRPRPPTRAPPTPDRSPLPP